MKTELLVDRAIRDPRSQPRARSSVYFTGLNEVRIKQDWMSSG